MRILIACEESQRVCIAFRNKGHEAYSCDILPCSGGHPEWHIQDDVLSILNDSWDMVIGFPPCTHLASSGARFFAKKKVLGIQQNAIDFFLTLANANAPKIAIENPVGIMSSHFRKPDQIVHPYQFGDPEAKKTCFWLKGLPKLIATNIVEPQYVMYKSKKNKSGYSRYGKITGSNPSTNNPKNAILRSKTYPGIAIAIAEQWG